MTEAEQQLAERLKGYEAHFDAAMDNDMNTAEAIGAIFELVKDTNVSLNAESTRAAVEAALKSFTALTDVLGLVQKDSLQVPEEHIPEEIMKLVEERAAARKAKDWKRSDELRDAIKAAGYILEDSREGQKVRKAQ